MGILKKFKALFHEDWCKVCQSEMNLTYKQLYMLPVMVDHYVTHNDAEYYKNNLIKVNKKSDIPAGTYACGIKKYKCPNCGYEATILSIFLPVRDQEKYEDTILFENGEMDSFF